MPRNVQSEATFARLGTFSLMTCLWLMGRILLMPFGIYIPSARIISTARTGSLLRMQKLDGLLLRAKKFLSSISASKLYGRIFRAAQP